MTQGGGRLGVGSFNSEAKLWELTLPQTPEQLAECLADIEGGFARHGTGPHDTHSCAWTFTHYGIKNTLLGYGYQTFGRNHAQKWTAAEQRRATLYIHVESLTSFTHAIRHLGDIVQWCLMIAGGKGRQVAHVHILRQSSQTARFTYHQDNLEDPLIELSFVFLLSSDGSIVTHVQMAGAEAYAYSGPGSGVCFPSVLWHRTGETSMAGDVDCIKLAVFITRETPHSREDKVKVGMIERPAYLSEPVAAAGSSGSS